MKKSFYILIICLHMSPYSAISQAKDTIEQFNDKPVIRLNLLGMLAFGFEKGIGNNFTIRHEAGLGWPLVTQEKNKEGKTLVTLESIVNPYILLEARHYYNIQRRIDQGRRTAYYAGNYLGIYYRYNAYEYQAGVSNNTKDSMGVLYRDVQYLGGSWGMQRSLGVKQLFYINWSIGPALKTNFKDYADFTFPGQIGLGLQW